MYRQWTPEDEAQLREGWGRKGGLPSLAKTLGRSVSAVKIRAQRLKLGPFINGGALVSFNMLYQIVVGEDIVGGYQFTKERWRRLGLPFKTVRCENNNFCMVDVQAFWRWAKKHQSQLDFSRFEENALGKEPDWAKRKRAVDIANRRLEHPKKCPWSLEEDTLLAAMLENGATHEELEHALKRSSAAIRRRIYDRGLPKPKRGRQKWWTDDELRIMVRMIDEGYSQDYTARCLGRSTHSVRGKIGFLHGSGMWTSYE